MSPKPDVFEFVFFCEEGVTLSIFVFFVLVQISFASNTGSSQVSGEKAIGSCLIETHPGEFFLQDSSKKVDAKKTEKNNRKRR